MKKFLCGFLKGFIILIPIGIFSFLIDTLFHSYPKGLFISWIIGFIIVCGLVKKHHQPKSWILLSFFFLGGLVVPFLLGSIEYQEHS